MGIARDLTNQKFGKLTALHIDKAFKPKSGDHFKWECLCDCGEKVSVRSNALISGGCTRCKKCKKTTRHESFVNLTGRKFGFLTVVKLSEKKKRGNWCWDCKCVCGNMVLAITNILQNGHKKSCGCWRDAHKKSSEVVAANRIICSYISSARSRKLVWAIKKEDALHLIAAPCSICGDLGSNCQKGPKGTEFYYNGIDRIDNDKGYELSNCQTLCITCNWAKSNGKETDFKKWTSRVTQHQLLMSNLRVFHLQRAEDVSGTSGVGIVAIGVQLPSGKCVMEWNSALKTDTLFDSIDLVERIHGHEGRTKVVMGLPPEGFVKK